MNVITQPASAEIPLLAKAMLCGRSRNERAQLHFQELKLAPDRVKRILEKGIITDAKAAVAAATTGDGFYGAALADWKISSSAFFSSLRTESVFFRLLDSGFRKVPLRTRLGVVTANATAFVANEGKPIPVSKLTLARTEFDTTSKVAALIVVSDEVARSADSAALSLINAELRGAVSLVADEAFFGLIIDSATPSIPSSGNAQTDIKQLLDIVAKGDGSVLAFAMSQDVANAVSVMDVDGRGAMTPLGGEIVGLPAMVSAAVPDGTLRLISAGAIAANADPISLSGTNAATIEMSDAPLNDSVTPTHTTMVSLFQSNSTALMAEAWLGAERTSDNAIAEVTGIEWFAAGS